MVERWIWPHVVTCRYALPLMVERRSGLVVEIASAFTPPGAGPIGENVTAEFRVTDGMHATVTCVQDHGDGCDPSGVYVEFDGPVADTMGKHISVEPRPKGLDIDQ